MKKSGIHQPKYISEFEGVKLPLNSAKILPSLSDPVYAGAENVTRTSDRDEVLGLTFNGIVRAYPTWIMDNYHIVNDTFEGAHLLVIH